MPRRRPRLVVVYVLLLACQMTVASASTMRVDKRYAASRVEVQNVTLVPKNGTSDSNANANRKWPRWFPRNNKKKTEEDPKPKRKSRKQRRQEKKEKGLSTPAVDANETNTTLESGDAEWPPIGNKTADLVTNETAPQEEVSTTEDVTSSTNATVSPDAEDTNQTSSSSSTPSSEAPFSPPPQQILILGPTASGGPQQQRYYRGGKGQHAQSLPRAIPLHQQQQLPPLGPRPSTTPQPLPPNTVLLLDVAASVLGTAMRLWLLTWLTRRLATQEEVLHPVQHYVWERLNDATLRDQAALATAVAAAPQGIRPSRWKRHVRRGPQAPRRQLNLQSTFARTVVVVELQTDKSGGIDLQDFSQLVSFLLKQHRNHAFGTRLTEQGVVCPKELEIVLCVQSPGGAVSTFGLAAAHMQRLTAADGIVTTVCVDRYAASGGYMIASQASKLLAAPFSTIGSIGVILEGLNFHELAKQYGIQPVTVKAGESKNPISTFGPITKQDLEEEQARMQVVHQAFQDLIVAGRPGLADRIAKVATGTVWLGSQALELGLVDDIMTSDEYLQQRMLAGDRVLKLHKSSTSRYPRRMAVSPLDLLPHLQQKVVQWWQQTMATNGDGEWQGRLVQVGSWLAVAATFYKQYGPSI